jgi:cytoskeletal protein RodZ
MEQRFQGPNNRFEDSLGGSPTRARLRLVANAVNPLSDFSSLGQYLRNARQCKGIELAEISSRLKISKRHLNAIEEGHVETLPPGNVYLIAYTRAYVNYLGLNTGQCEQKLKSEIAERKSSSQAVIAPPQKHKLPSAVRHTLKFLGIMGYDL